MQQDKIENSETRLKETLQKNGQVNLIINILRSVNNFINRVAIAKIRSASFKLAVVNVI